MSKFLFIFIFTMIVSLNVFSNELNAEFSISDQVKELKEGETFSGTLRIWPLENPNKEEFMSLVGTDLFDGFYVVFISSMEPSPNNADVFEIKADFIANKKINPDKLFINVNGSPVRVKYKEVLFHPLELKNQEFEVVDQEDDYSYTNILLFLLAPIILVIAVLKRDLIISKFKKKKKEDPKENFKKIFYAAKERKDFENIYLLKDEWMPLLEAVTPSHREFFNILNSHQYKKEWNKFEQNEIEESFEVIRRSFG